MRILITIPKLTKLSDTDHWISATYNAFTKMGHEIRVKTLSDDAPPGYLVHTNGKYDIAFIFDPHDGNYINADLKIGVVTLDSRWWPENVDTYVQIMEPMPGDFMTYLPIPIDMEEILHRYGPVIHDKLKDPHDSFLVVSKCIKLYEQFVLD